MQCAAASSGGQKPLFFQPPVYKENFMKRIIYTITLGFSLGIFTCCFLNYITNPHNEDNNRQHKNSSIDGSIFLSNAQKNVSEDDGGFFIPSPHVEESIIEGELQNV